MHVRNTHRKLCSLSLSEFPLSSSFSHPLDLTNLFKQLFRYPSLGPHFLKKRLPPSPKIKEEDPVGLLKPIFRINLDS